MTRFQKLVIALLAALIVIIGVGAVVIIQQQARAETQAIYERCMAAHGYTVNNTPATEAELQEMLDKTQDCI